jgi:hypothetical protein
VNPRSTEGDSVGGERLTQVSIDPRSGRVCWPWRAHVRSHLFAVSLRQRASGASANIGVKCFLSLYNGHLRGRAMGRDWVIETHAQISIRWLGRQGLFQRDPEDFLFIQFDNAQFAFINQDSNSIKVYYIYNEKPYSTTIELAYVRVEFGYKRFFICPVTGRRVSIIHFIAGNFASRAGLRGILGVKNGSPAARQKAQRRRRIDRLLGRDGRGPARGKSRERLIEVLRYDTQAMLECPEIGPAIAKYDAQQRAAARSRHWGGVKRGPGAMATVLEHCRDLRDTRAFQAYSEQPAQQWMSASPLPVLPDMPRPLTTLEDCIALDIRAIAERFDLGRSELWGVELNWPQPAGAWVSFRLFVDLRSRDHACLAVCHLNDGVASPAQLIRIRQPFGSKRWSMVCPLTDKNCDLLYWRSGFFASEKAQRLIRRSQRLQSI